MMEDEMHAQHGKEPETMVAKDLHLKKHEPDPHPEEKGEVNTICGGLKWFRDQYVSTGTSYTGTGTNNKNGTGTGTNSDTGTGTSTGSGISMAANNLGQQSALKPGEQDHAGCQTAGVNLGPLRDTIGAAS
jgi:hypothetical protein